jgi:hypothetical protein
VDTLHAAISRRPRRNCNCLQSPKLFLVRILTP